VNWRDGLPAGRSTPRPTSGAPAKDHASSAERSPAIRTTQATSCGPTTRPWRSSPDYNTLLGHTLVTPRAHREQVTADFNIEEYLGLQRLVYYVGEALRQELPTERLYIMSLGSQSGNRHIHWHVAPLPPGIPHQEQQFAAFSWNRGVLALPDDDLADLARRIGTRVEQMHPAG
jgi:diadenosine tetraphosphate (Ap4A) HIT family hydrolase